MTSDYNSDADMLQRHPLFIQHGPRSLAFASPLEPVFELGAAGQSSITDPCYSELYLTPTHNQSKYVIQYQLNAVFQNIRINPNAY